MKDKALTENRNTFSEREYIERFRQYIQMQGHSGATEQNHLANLTYLQKFLSEQNQSLVAVTAETVAAYQAWLLEYKTRFNRPLAINSQIAILSSLNVFYAFLHKTGRILNNPTESLRLPKERRNLPEILTTKEMKKLLRKPDLNTVSGFRDRAMMELLYSCGIRISELIQLKVNAFNVSESSIQIIAGKGGKDRVVPVGKTALNFLSDYVSNVRPLLLKEKTDVLFLNRFGQKFGVSGLLKKIQKYAARVRIEKRVTVHTFRHTLATEMLRKGAELRHIQELLGHESLRTTERYLHIVKTELKRAQAKHHPREAIDLPDGVIKYHGFK